MMSMMKTTMPMRRAVVPSRLERMVSILVVASELGRKVGGLVPAMNLPLT